MIGAATSAASAAWERLRGMLGPPGPPDLRSPEELEHDLADELAFHLHMLEREEREAGLDAPVARAVARERFGDPEVIRAACRRVALKERIMLQRINTVLVVLLVLAVVGLGVQGWMLNRTNARTLAAVDALRVAVENERAAANEALLRATKAAETARGNMAAPVPPTGDGAATKDTSETAGRSSPTRRQYSFIVDVSGAIGRRGRLEGSVPDSPLASLKTVLDLAGGLSIPEPYQAMEGTTVIATVRRARGDGSDEVMGARWPMSSEPPVEPKVASLDKIEFALEPQGAPPPLADNDVLGMVPGQLVVALDILDFALRDASSAAETRTRLLADRTRVANRMRVMGLEPRALARANGPQDPAGGPAKPVALDVGAMPMFDRTTCAWIDGPIRSKGRAFQVSGTPVSTALQQGGGLAGPAVYLNASTVNVTVLRPRGDGTDQTLSDTWEYGKDPGTLRLIPADRVTLGVTYPTPLPPIDEATLLKMRASSLHEAHPILAKAIAAGGVDEPTLDRYRNELEAIRLRLAAMGEKPMAAEKAPDVPPPSRVGPRAAGRDPGFAVVLGDVKQPGPYEIPPGGLLCAETLVFLAEGKQPPRPPRPSTARAEGDTFEVVLVDYARPVVRLRVLPDGTRRSRLNLADNSDPACIGESGAIFVRKLTSDEADAPTPAGAPDALDVYLAKLTPDAAAALKPVEQTAVRRGIAQALTRNPDAATRDKLTALGAAVALPSAGDAASAGKPAADRTWKPGFAVVLGDVKSPGRYELPRNQDLTAAKLIFVADGRTARWDPTLVFEAVTLLPQAGDVEVQRFRVLSNGASQTIQRIDTSAPQILRDGGVVIVRRLGADEAETSSPLDSPDALDVYLSKLAPETLQTLDPVELRGLRKAVEVALTRKPDEAAAARLNELRTTIDTSLTSAK